MVLHRFYGKGMKGKVTLKEFKPVVKLVKQVKEGIIDEVNDTIKLKNEIISKEEAENKKEIDKIMESIKTATDEKVKAELNSKIGKLLNDNKEKRNELLKEANELVEQELEVLISDEGIATMKKLIEDLTEEDLREKHIQNPQENYWTPDKDGKVEGDSLIKLFEFLEDLERKYEDIHTDK
jgi:hypothetical protein